MGIPITGRPAPERCERRGATPREGAAYMDLRRASRSSASRSTSSSSARAPTRASRICARRPTSARAQGGAGRPHAGRAGLAAGQAPGRGRRARPHLPRGRRRWREAGCSMCIAMNGDQLAPGQYAVSHVATATSRAGRARAGAPSSPAAHRRRRGRRRHRSSITASLMGGAAMKRGRAVHHARPRHVVARRSTTSTPTRSSRRAT